MDQWSKANHGDQRTITHDLDRLQRELNLNLGAATAQDLTGLAGLNLLLWEG